MSKIKKTKSRFNRPGGIHAKRNCGIRYTLSKKLRYLLLKKRPGLNIDKTNVKVSLHKFYSVQTNGLKLTFTKSLHQSKTINRDGYRIINLNLLAMHILDITTHCMRCTQAQAKLTDNDLPVKLIGEVKRLGLASVIAAVCLGCNKTFTFDTSSKIECSNSNNRFDINVRSVWGQMSTGGGQRL